MLKDVSSLLTNKKRYQSVKSSMDLSSMMSMTNEDLKRLKLLQYSQRFT